MVKNAESLVTDYDMKIDEPGGGNLLPGCIFGLVRPSCNKVLEFRSLLHGCKKPGGWMLG